MDHFSLEKNIVRVSVGQVYDTNGLSNFLVFRKELDKIEKKAVKEGFKNLQVDICHEPGDENNLDHSYLNITGERLETEEEWHKRLESQRNRLERELEEAQRTVNGTYHKTKIEEYDKVLEKSALRCIKCNILWPGMCYGGKLRKLTRVCPKCYDKYYRN